MHEKGTKKEMFQLHFEHLVKQLRNKYVYRYDIVLIMDNLASHKGLTIIKWAEKYHIQLLYVPANSPM